MRGNDEIGERGDGAADCIAFLRTYGWCGWSKSGMKNATVSLDPIGCAQPGSGRCDAKGQAFSRIQLVDLVAIILIIAAIAVPSFLNSRMAANESSAVSLLHTRTQRRFQYTTTYATVGYAANLTALAGTCTGSTVPTSTSACLIDSVLESGTKSGYTFVLQGVSGAPASSYQFIASPVNSVTGVRSFCSFEDAVIRVSLTAITTCDSTVSEQQ